MNNRISSKQSFLNSIYFSTKHDSYFRVYDNCVEKILSKSLKKITIVEVGILHGGSLFMWRDLFGPEARIIGVDLNPEARKWQEHGFEIYIGNQSSPIFWKEFYDEVGLIDFLIDDGGHTNRQQIVTTVHALVNMNPGGIILIEDTNTSFSKSFGNPSRFSFINFSKSYVDSLYDYDGASNRINSSKRKLESITFFDSIVLFETESEEQPKSTSVDNKGIRDSASDFRYDDLGYFSAMTKLVTQWSARRAQGVIANNLARRIEKTSLEALYEFSNFIFHCHVRTRMKLENLRLRIYWRK
jgi:hypothetical protein